MFIPLDDRVRRTSFWFCTLALIAANVYVFLVELDALYSGANLNALIQHYAIVPARYTTPQGLARLTLPGGVESILVAMFLHGGWLHLLGNMLFLFVFGRSIEDRFGHLKFLFIYFASGFAGAVLHIALNAGSRVPTIGASGAIAGVLGAYFVCFPRARITVTFFPLVFWTFDVMAVFVLGYWFLIQFLQGYQMLAIESATGGGVAWWAHVGGFVCGMILALALAPRPSRSIVLTDL